MNGSELESWGFRRRGVIGVAVLAPLGVFALLSAPPSADGQLAHVAANLVAWPAFLAGAGLRLWATLYVGGRKRNSLVVQGPYSMCRNPLYLGSVLLALSAGLFLESAWFSLGVLVVALGYVVVTVPVEERFLRQRFGAAYDDYLRRVPRFLPRPWLFNAGSALEVNLASLRAECMGALGYIWIPAIAEIVNSLRLQLWWPHLFS